LRICQLTTDLISLFLIGITDLLKTQFNIYHINIHLLEFTKLILFYDITKHQFYIYFKSVHSFLETRLKLSYIFILIFKLQTNVKKEEEIFQELQIETTFSL